MIIMNNCYQCYESGIVSQTKKEKRCDAKIWYNTCEKNRQYGILCQGLDNKTKVEKNVSISHNTLAGLCVKDLANIVITNNYFELNFGQGILLLETTYCHIEKNTL